MDLADLNPFETLREIERVECETSLYTFLQHAWKYIDPSPFTHGWPLEAMCEHLEAVADGDIRKLLINVPPRCGKSTLVSVAFPAWVWTQREIGPVSGPQVALLHASYAMSLAMRDSVKTRRLIESPWYQRLWGHRFQLVGDQNTKGRFQNDKRGERLITAVDARVTGEGGSIIIVDDANAANEALSEALIETTKDWWDGTMSTRLNDARTGAYIVIQQRLGEEDLTGHILDTDDGWTHLMLPMEFEPERSVVTSIGWEDPRTEAGELLWPERFATEQVEVLKKRLGPWKAAGQLQQRPEPKGGGIIKRDWWQLHDAPHFPQFDYVLASLDTAFTTKQENDFSALTVWGIFTTDTVAQPSKQVIRGERLVNIDPRDYGNQAPKVMLMNAWQERLELHDLVQRVAKTCKEMKVDRLLIEDKAAGHSVAQELRRLFGYEDFAVQLVNPGAIDKVARVYAIQHIFAEGMVFAPDRQWAEMTIAQCTAFPRGKHDDLCLVGATQIAMADGATQRLDAIYPGDLVMTRDGPRRVSAAVCTGVRPTYLLRHEQGTLEGTGNHPVWADGEWRALETLYPCAMLETLYPQEVTWDSSLQAALGLKRLYSKVIDTTATLIHRMQRIGATLRGPALACTERYGSGTTALFLKGGRYTTSTGTPPTTGSKIWSACRARVTEKSTTPTMWRGGSRLRSANFWRAFGQRLRNGIAVLKGVSGTGRTPGRHSTSPENPNLSAKAVTLESAYGAAQRMWRRIHAVCSVRRNVAGSTRASSAVLAVTATPTMQRVYNLTVEDAHHYYANGVLVHNCDTISQALTYMRRAGLLTRSSEHISEVGESLKHRGAPPANLYGI